MLDPNYLNNPHFPKDISKTLIHILKRSLNALGRKFSDLEPKFDKRVHQLLSMDKIDVQSKSLGYIIKTYKDKYFMLKKKDYRDAAELVMLKDLEDEIIKFSIEYINIGDQKIKQTNALRYTEKIKQKIKSYDYPLETLTPKMILSILRQLVRIDDQNYVLVINSAGDMILPHKIKIRVFKARFFSSPSRLITGDSHLRVFLFAQLPLSPLLTRKRVLILF